jgi:hypothetical protein
LWTSRAVRDLIALRFGKTLGLSTVQLYLQRWGMTPQKPLARAKERQPAAIAAWLATTYPAIARRARAERAVIYWGDETGISNQDQIGRCYAPKGRTPVVARSAKRVTQSMISAVSNRGLMRFMLYDGALNAGRFIAFLRRLIKDAGQKVVLIVDNLKVHHAAKVTDWATAHAHEIELCYLPAYAPDHNPDEYLNNDLKQQLRPDIATQSGPMLVINGRLHPRFVHANVSLKQRSGVGVRDAQTVVFAISDDEVSFQAFGRLFLERLKCNDALFLDGGSVPTLYAPSLNRGANLFSLGPMIGVFEKAGRPGTD